MSNTYGYKDKERQLQIKNKISKKELKEEIRTVISGEHIDFDIPKQDEIIQQIFGR